MKKYTNKIFKVLLIIGLLTSMLYGEFKKGSIAEGNSELEIGFTEKYDAKIIIESISKDRTECVGIFLIIERKTKKRMLTIHSNHIYFESDENLLEENMIYHISDFSFSEENIIYFQDFNFDGKKDVAVLDEEEFGPYGSSVYKIYLQDGGKLKYSPEFSQLTQEYMGLFEVNYKRKIITAFTKSGCSWHQYVEFEVVDNEPMIVKVVEEESDIRDIPIMHYLEKTFANNKTVEKKYSAIYDDGFDKSFEYSFRVEGDNKMFLFEYHKQLYYAFTNSKNIIKLLYSGDFKCNKKRQTLSFTNYRVKYEISTRGILVTTPTKRVFIKAIVDSEKRDFSELLGLNFTNMKRSEISSK